MNILITSAGRRGYIVEYFKDVIQLNNVIEYWENEWN